MAAKTADQLMRLWNFLNKVPAGNYLFNAFIKWRIPYTASISSRITKFEIGHVCVALKDRKKIRNHLNSIHAIAMANLGEFTGGLALLSWLPCHYRGIPIKLSIDYFKKARGQLFAESTVTPATLSDEMEFMVQTDIKDQQGDIVAVTTAIWRLGVIEDAKG